jgi:methionyl-tRNA synthetase
MEGRKFSSSRSVVIYVRDFLSRYDADALRYYIAVAGPENQDTDFTWAEFLRRTNDELVAGWGNLVNRSISLAAKNVGAVPEPGPLEAVDEALLALSREAFDTVGALLERSRIKAAVTEAMRLVGETNKYLSDMAPWKLAKTDTARMATVLYVALQLVDDCKTLLTPFLPHSSQQVHELLGGAGDWSGFPEIHEVTEDGSDAPYLVITGSYASAAARWESTPLVPGTPLAAPTPIFRKLDPSIVDDELRRLADDADSRQQPPS